MTTETSRIALTIAAAALLTLGCEPNSSDPIDAMADGADATDTADAGGECVPQLLTDADVDDGATLPADTCWRVEEQLAVERGTLTIEPGVSLAFVGDVGLVTRRDGAIDAQGTADRPITFTSASPSPAPGDWRGLWLGSTEMPLSNRLDHVVVEFGGSSDWTSNPRSGGCIYVNGDDGFVDLSNSTVQSCAGQGLRFTGGPGTLAVATTTFRGSPLGVSGIAGLIPTLAADNDHIYAEHNQLRWLCLSSSCRTGAGCF